MADKKNTTFEHELRRLEKRVDALVRVCDQLQDENKSLKQRGSDDRKTQGYGTRYLTMSEPYAQVSVRILDKEYQVACPASERTDLLDSAEILNDKMREIRDSGRVVGLDRIAVMAALNMANELIHAEARDRLLEGDVSDRLKLISDRVENVLGESQQLDL
jgi:cell division protein ZapA